MPARPVTPASTPTSPNPAPPATEYADHNCPKCDGPVKIISGKGTKADPNEPYTAEKCAAKGCDYIKRLE
jgi:hypothetical protein